MIRIFSSPEYLRRLLRLILRTVLTAVVFLVFLAIALSSKSIVADGENLSYLLLPICPIVSDVTVGGRLLVRAAFLVVWFKCLSFKCVAFKCVGV